MAFPILVVDDEEMQRDILTGFLEKQGFQVFAAASGAEALRLFADLPIQLVLLDHRMPDLTGDEVLARMKDISPRLRAIMITAFGEVATAVRVMKLGADDFLEKPVDLAELLAKVRQIEQELMVQEEAEQVSAQLAAAELPLAIIGSGPAMTGLLSLVRRLAPSPWTVLIRGETGTGKELIARLIHLLSPRQKGPFVAVNCAAIPEGLFESELFGHEKGAFTGAIGRRIGRFEQASAGSLFLDEIAELPINLQAKLLRTLQEKTVTRVGGDRELSVDVRLIAASHQDLKDLVAQGRFRQDLYYRLHVLELELPALRHRRQDIPELAEHFLSRYAPRPLRLSAEALTILSKYPFPGNVRELEHIVQRAAILARGPVITPADLPAEVLSPEPGQGSLDERLTALEASLIREALIRHDWVQTRAAADLGISERVLRYKMGRLNLKGP